MPQTRQSSSSSSSSSGDTTTTTTLKANDLNMLRDYERQAKMQILKMESMFDMLLLSFETQINEALYRLPREIRQLTLAELQQQQQEEDNNNNEDDGFDEVSSTASSDYHGAVIIKQEYSLIRPKFKPNAPMTLLRHPKQGEIVVSMQGSPILVSAIVAEERATINVPLENHTVMSIMPNQGLRLSLLPELDHYTVQQLKTLKGHIDRILENK